ncbi:MAG TPA: glycoside hydrolase family 2 TIM barrel-domain containing protein [Anaerolineae bacterium]
MPGNVRTDLLALGRIPEPFYAEQYKASAWVEDVDWWYRCVLAVEPLAPEQRAFLEFDGIDYLSAICIAGREVGLHEGMFSAQRIELTGLLRSDLVEVAVRLWGSSALPRRQLTWPQRAWQRIAAPVYGSWVGIYPDRSATLKCQMSFGWDFAPPIRTMGIWDEVRLVINGPVFIAEASATGRPTSPPGETPTHAPAQLSVDLTFEADRPRRVQAAVRLEPANFQGASFGPFDMALELPAGRSAHRFELNLPEAALWQPWDCGEPHLYHVRISLFGVNGEPLDEVVVRTGLRSIERQGWQFSLNGRPEFMRGLNWVPADSFPGRLRRDRYQHLLTMARQSGANLLRVWGGGLREKRAFYELCDELGLLVWQEFPFACMFLGAYPRQQSYLSFVAAECTGIVRRLRHHPSLLTWCGGNEFSRWRNRPLLDTLAGIVRRHDGTRPFIPVSPGFDHGRDAHNWHVWHGEAPIQAYQAETAAFLSEFGLQALPHLDTLQAALPDPTTAWSTHHADLPKLTRYTTLFKENPSPHPHSSTLSPIPYPLSHISNPTSQIQNLKSKIQNLKSKIASSQRAQAVALQTAIETMRRRKGQTGGVCLWQFNEPWPAISWAIVDYFGRPKLAYERLPDWYSPILISLNFPVGHRWEAGQTFTAEIWAINDGLAAFEDCRLHITIDQTPVHTQSFDLPTDYTQKVGELAHRLTASPRRIALYLEHENEVLARNSYDLGWSEMGRSGFYQRVRRWVAELALR